MTPEETVRDYYETLRAGDPLPPFFTDEPNVVKFGIGETLVGADAVAEGLREQTRRTQDWTIESHALRAVNRGEYAAFSDRVNMGWRDAVQDRNHDYETRWSGTLERKPAEGSGSEWQFLGMHVSVPGPTAER